MSKHEVNVARERNPQLLNTKVKNNSMILTVIIKRSRVCANMKVDPDIMFSLGAEITRK